MHPRAICNRSFEHSTSDGTGHDKDRYVRDVEDPAHVRVDTTRAGDDDLRGMTREAELPAKRHELGMPHGKERVLIVGSFGTGEHGVNRYPGEPFVDEMLIQASAAK